MSLFSGFPLNRGQVAIMAVLGASLWLVGALLLKFVAPLGAYDGLGRVLLYVLIIPGTLPFIFIAKTLAKLSPSQTGLGVSIAVATAILLDGLALPNIPALYGSSLEHTAGAGAAILWGGGVALVLGFLLTKKD